MGRNEEAPGLAKFIHQKNGTGVTRTSSLDDLKVPVPKTSANTQSTRVGGPKTRAQSKTPNPQHSRRNVPRTLHDTDASFGKTTTASGSTRRAHSAGDDKKHYVKEPSHVHPDEEANLEEFEYVTDHSGEDDQEEELPEHPMRATAHGGAPHAPHAKPDGRNLGRISGDTYPETTSGRPSTTHADDHREPQTAAYPQLHSAQPMAMPERGAGTRLTYPPAIMQQLPHGQHGHQGHPGQQQSLLPLPRPEDLMNDVNSGFSFGMAASNKMQASRPPPAQPAPSQHHSTKPMPSNAAQRGPPTTINQVPKQEVHRQEPEQQLRAESQYTAPAPMQPEVRKQPLEGARQYATPEPRHSRPPPQQQQHYRRHGDNEPAAQNQEAPHSEMMSEFGDQNNNNVPRGSSVEQQHEVQEAAPLDYPPEQLYKMAFGDLKAASFDADPNVKPPDMLSAFQADETLPKKLDALLTMDHQSKREYFGSLGIEEWEEAGDWFLESFAKLVERFKMARREKRKIARDFENEVELRYESVSKKQKLTKGALDEMRQSGGKVLQGTPKKGGSAVQ